METLICAIPMQLVTILKGVTPALATVDTQEMNFAQVSASTFQSEYITLLARLIAFHSNIVKLCYTQRGYTLQRMF